MSQRTRIAVVGAGLIGLTHIRLAQASPTCALAAIVEPVAVAREAAACFGVPVYATLDESFAATEVDGVIVASPNRFHVEQALRCIDAGVGVLIEKPVADTVAEGERLAQEVEARRARVIVGHHRAHGAVMQRAKAAIEAGRLGRIVAVTGSATWVKPAHYFDDGPWRREIGGGPILINMIHEVHSLRMLCGEIAAVQAIASNAVRRFAVEDTVAINLRFASGALGTFMLSDVAASARNWEHTAQENPAYPTCPDEDCYVVMGTLGSLSIPTLRIKSYASEADASWWKPFDTSVLGITRVDPLARQLEHFGAVIRGEAQPLVSVHDGLANLRVLEAIVEAAHSGGTVAIARPA
jgi:predicted dehydrogenase